MVEQQERERKPLLERTRAVSFAVTVECRFDGELATALFTAEWLFTSVNANMSGQIARLLEPFATCRTLVHILGSTTAVSLWRITFYIAARACCIGL